MRCPSLEDLPPPPPGKTGWPWTEESPQLPAHTPEGNGWPCISIVTPSFNQGEFIEETIRSVLLQGYPNLEYIIIDGKSDDNSIEIIKKYSPWLARWVSETDTGQAGAINKGLSWSQGAVLGYLNSDDIYYPCALSTLTEQVGKEILQSQCILSGPVQDFGDAENLLWHSNSSFGRLVQWFDGGISLHQPGVLWTRVLWERCGPFREDLDYTFDRFFFATAFIINAKHYFTSKTIAGFRLHSKSKTSLNFIKQDHFSRDWEYAKLGLESKLTARQKISLSFHRNLAENWRLVEGALDIQSDSEEKSKSLIAKVKREPWWLLHRPVAGAFFRLLCMRMKIKD